MQKHSRGPGPVYFSAEYDRLLKMTLSLVEEVSVLRDRIDSIERVAEQKQVFSSADVEGYRPDADVAAHRGERRMHYIERMLRDLFEEAAEMQADSRPAEYADVVKMVS
jgi:hypothetical protein